MTIDKIQKVCYNCRYDFGRIRFERSLKSKGLGKMTKKPLRKRMKTQMPMMGFGMFSYKVVGVLFRMLDTIATICVAMETCFSGFCNERENGMKKTCIESAAIGWAMWIVLFLFGGRIDAIAHLPHNAQMVFWAGSFVLLPVFIYQIWSIGSGQTETAMKENPDEASWDTPMDETLRVEASDSANQVRTTNLFNVLCLGVLVIAGCVAVGFIVLKVMALLTASGGEYQFWADFLGKFVLPALLGIAAMLKVGSFLPEQDDRIMGYREHLKDILAAKGYPRWLAWVGQIVTLLVLGRLAIGLYLGGAWQITLIAYHGGTIWALAGWVTVGLIGLACGYVALCVGMEIVKHVKFRIFGREDDGAQCVVK